MFQGLRTLTYGVKDLAAAKAWYTDILGFGPYFDQPFYAGFEVGGYELGLDPGSQPGNGERTGPLAHWGVDDIDAAYATLVEKGAKGISAPEEVGDGIRVAALSDPFGNVFGIIYNPHFKLPGQ